MSLKSDRRVSQRSDSMPYGGPPVGSGRHKRQRRSVSGQSWNESEMKRRRPEWPPTPPEQLDALSRYSESDKRRAREAAAIDASPRLRAMLDAEVDRVI
jgi:hypothetical protein